MQWTMAGRRGLGVLMVAALVLVAAPRVESWAVPTQPELEAAEERAAELARLVADAERALGEVEARLAQLARDLADAESELTQAVTAHAAAQQAATEASDRARVAERGLLLASAELAETVVLLDEIARDTYKYGRPAASTAMAMFETVSKSDDTTALADRIHYLQRGVGVRAEAVDRATVLKVEVEHFTSRAQIEEEEHQRQLAIADAARDDAASLHAQVQALTDETSYQLERSMQLVAALESEQGDVEARIVSLEAQVAAELEDRARREREAREAAERERLAREAAERDAAERATVASSGPAPSNPTPLVAAPAPVAAATAESSAPAAAPAPSAPAVAAPAPASSAPAPSAPAPSAPAPSAPAPSAPAPSAPAVAAPAPAPSAPASSAPAPSAPAVATPTPAPSASAADPGAAERERQAEAQAERERQARAQADREAAARAEADREAAERAERERQAAERAERERQAAERAERERQAAERAERERQEREAAERAAQAERDRKAQEERERQQREAAQRAASTPIQAGPSANLRTVGGITVASSLAPNLQALLDHARRDGIVLGGSGYRSPEITARLRLANGCPDVYTSPPSSCRVATAIPGTSEHEKGLAVDFTYQGQTICFPLRSSSCTGNRAFDWLRRNASSYGFYNLPSEAWHWSTTGR